MTLKNEVKLKKTISLFALLTFSFTNLVSAAPAQGVSPSIRVEKKSQEEVNLGSLAAKLEIPENLGSIQARFTPNAANTGTVIHIQDAHASNDAQANIRAILEHLHKTYGVEQIFLEGGMGEIRPELLLYFKEEAHNKKLAERFQKESLIGGAELFLLDDYYQNHEASAYGVENPSLYVQNLEAFQAVMNQKQNSEKFLSNLKSKINTQASRVFNKDLKAFFREWAFYQDVQEEAMRHLKTLEKQVKTHMGLDFRNLETQIEWPQLVRVIRLQDLEGKIDSAKVESERKAVEAWKVEQGAEDFKNLLEAAQNSSVKVENPRKIAEQFYLQASAKGFSFEKYPELSKALGRVILSHEIQPAQLFQEIEILTQKLLNHLAKTEEEKKIVTIYADYLKLRKLFSLELVRSEYQEVEKRRSEMKPSLLMGAEAAEMDVLYGKALSFYNVAIQRETAIFSHVMETMLGTGEHTSVLITGGFHSEGLSQMIKNQNLAYVEIMPRIANLKDVNNYEKIMMLNANSKVSFLTHNTPAGTLALPAIIATADKIAAGVGMGLGASVVPNQRAEVRKKGLIERFLAYWIPGSQPRTRKNREYTKLGGEGLENRAFMAGHGLDLPPALVAGMNLEDKAGPISLGSSADSDVKIEGANAVLVNFNTNANGFAGGGVAYAGFLNATEEKHFLLEALIQGTQDVKLELSDAENDRYSTYLTDLSGIHSKVYEIDFSDASPEFDPSHIKTVLVVIEGAGKIGSGYFQISTMDELPAVIATVPNGQITETLPNFAPEKIDVFGIANTDGVTGQINTLEDPYFGGVGFKAKEGQAGVSVNAIQNLEFMVTLTSDQGVPYSKIDILGSQGNVTVYTASLQANTPTLVSIPLTAEMKNTLGPEIRGAVLVIETDLNGVIKFEVNSEEPTALLPYTLSNQVVKNDAGQSVRRVEVQDPNRQNAVIYSHDYPLGLIPNVQLRGNYLVMLHRDPNAEGGAVIDVIYNFKNYIYPEGSHQAPLNLAQVGLAEVTVSPEDPNLIYVRATRPDQKGDVTTTIKDGQVTATEDRDFSVITPTPNALDQIVSLPFAHKDGVLDVSSIAVQTTRETDTKVLKADADQTTAQIAKAGEGFEISLNMTTPMTNSVKIGIAGTGTEIRVGFTMKSGKKDSVIIQTTGNNILNAYEIALSEFQKLDFENDIPATMFFIRVSPKVSETDLETYRVQTTPIIKENIEIVKSGDPYSPYGDFGGGVNIATGDVNGDGVLDTITGAGIGGGPHVKVYNGATGAEMLSFFAYTADFTGGVNVASADVDGDGRADIITGAGIGGGPHVKVYNGATGAEMLSFFAYTADFTGGVNVASADVDGDGRADIITGAGTGGGPHVKVFSGSDGIEIASFFAYTADFTGGVRVAAGDVNGDGRADIITGAGIGGGPHVKAYNVENLNEPVANFFAFGADVTEGLYVAAADLNRDGKAEIIVSASHYAAVFGPEGQKILDIPYGGSNTETEIHVAAAIDAQGNRTIVTSLGAGEASQVQNWSVIKTSPAPALLAEESETPPSPKTSSPFDEIFAQEADLYSPLDEELLDVLAPEVSRSESRGMLAVAKQLVGGILPSHLPRIMTERLVGLLEKMMGYSMNAWSDEKMLAARGFLGLPSSTQNKEAFLLGADLALNEGGLVLIDTVFKDSWAGIVYQTEEQRTKLEEYNKVERLDKGETAISLIRDEVELNGALLKAKLLGKVTLYGFASYRENFEAFAGINVQYLNHERMQSFAQKFAIALMTKFAVQKSA